MESMKLRQKVILLAITPLILALCAIALFVRHQAITLAAQQRETIQQAYLASKEIELKHYVALASHSIAHLTNSGKSDEATKDEAKRILSSLSFGNDGYFFVYDYQGNNLMHPRQPELVGRNLWDMRDANGEPTIQRLLAKARSGGGLQRYMWAKPSSSKTAPKLGYVVPVANWNWMMGTGIYLDDVDAALAKIDTQQSRNIQSTMLWIAAMAIVSALVVALSGLVSIKLQIEAGVIRLSGNAEQQQAARASFEHTAQQLNDVLGEVRRISHDLRPAILDDLGLAAALDHLAQECTHNGGVPVRFRAEGSTDGLPHVANTVLFRIAQEALTNIERHAHASCVDITLVRNGRKVVLAIADNGSGFDPVVVASHPKRGIGLRNMMERMDAIGGQLKINSTPAGTSVQASVEAGA
jgi:two-component system NarL family sensor kinase